MATDLERWEVKALCMFGLFASMSIFVLLPIRVSKAVERQGKRGLFILSVLSCFGGGVFFGAYLIHLNPEVRAVLEEALLEPNNLVYPIPEALAGFGFFLILFLEKGILYCQHSGTKKEKKEKFVEGSNFDDEHLPYQVNVRITGASFKSTQEDSLAEGHNVVGRFFPSDESRARTASQGNQKQDEKSRSRSASREAPANVAEVAEQNGHVNKAADLVDEKKPSYDVESTKSSVSTSSSSSRDLVEESDDGAAKTRSLIFVIALSLDCIFEGLALGLMDNKLDVVNLFVAIISHEFIMSFCIGLELVKHYPTKKVVPAGLIYAFTPVFGAIIGTAIREGAGTIDNENTIDIVSGVLQAISAGTFIYCSFIGILSEELTHDNGFWKALSTLFGFAIMAAMAAIPVDSQGQEVEATTMTYMTTDILNTT